MRKEKRKIQRDGAKRKAKEKKTRTEGGKQDQEKGTGDIVQGEGA